MLLACFILLGAASSGQYYLPPVGEFALIVPPAAMRELGNLNRREMGRWLNNRVANSHLQFRRRERAMLRFRRMKSLQKFVSVHAGLHNHFNQERHLIDCQTFKLRRSATLAVWQSLGS